MKTNKNNINDFDDNDQRHHLQQQQKRSTATTINKNGRLPLGRCWLLPLAMCWWHPSPSLSVVSKQQQHAVVVVVLSNSETVTTTTTATNLFKNPFAAAAPPPAVAPTSAGIGGTTTARESRARRPHFFFLKDDDDDDDDELQKTIYSQPSSTRTTTATKDFVSEQLNNFDDFDDNDEEVEDQEEEDCVVQSKSPAVVFGRPIDKQQQENNKQFIHKTKTWLFDTLFPTTTTTQQQQQPPPPLEAGAAASAEATTMVLGMDRNFARFYALETIARVPYFSYLSVLHLFETLGLWRRADYLKVHFAESWNELHHLLIMEELLLTSTNSSSNNSNSGAGILWRDRFVAQHVAFFYYWIVVALYLFNPTNAYNLNQAVEEEAYETYDTFIKQYGESYLKHQPAPHVAKVYYTGQDMYLFDSMHLDKRRQLKQQQTEMTRRPKCDTLLDCFLAIRDDELEHVKTMSFLQGDSCRPNE